MGAVEIISTVTGNPLFSVLKVVQYPLDFSKSASGGIVHLAHEFLSAPSNALLSLSVSLSNVLNDIWLWLLYNLLMPIMIFIMIALFFVAQYYLIKAYIYVFSNIINKCIGLFGVITNSKKFINLKKKIDFALS